MVLVNIILLCTTGFGLFFYRYVFPKKPINLFILLLLLSILPIVSIFRAGSYQSGDLSLHVKYAMPFWQNLIQGNLVPQWSGQDCSLYGCAWYMFIYILPYYVISFFHIFGFSFLFSTKLLLICSFIASGIGMYLWVKQETGKVAGFVASVFYLYAPYHLIDLHFRASIGEILSFALLPFAFLSMKLIVKNKKWVYVFLLGVILSCLLLSHLPTSIFSFPIIFFYGVLLLFEEKSFRPISIFQISVPFVLSCLFTLFYTLPLMQESKFIIFSRPIVDFFPTAYYFFAPVRAGFLFQGHKGELYPILGYVQWLLLLCAIVLVLLKKIANKSRLLLAYFLIFFVGLFLLMQSFTLPVWNILPFLKDIQFTYRIMLELSFIISFVAGAIAQELYKRKKFLVLFMLCFVAIASTILNWGNRQTEPQVTDALLQKQSVSPEIRGLVEVTTPIWVNIRAPWIGTFPKAPIEVLSGNAHIRVLLHNQTLHTYQVSVVTPSVLKENTYYFPGWKLFINNKMQTITYTNNRYPGIMTFSLKPGKYLVTLTYTPTPISMLGQLVSLCSFVLLLLLLCLLLLIERGSGNSFHSEEVSLKKNNRSSREKKKNGKN